jgi:hypothetical protein
LLIPNARRVNIGPAGLANPYQPHPLRRSNVSVIATVYSGTTLTQRPARSATVIVHGFEHESVGFVWRKRSPEWEESMKAIEADVLWMLDAADATMIDCSREKQRGREKNL